MPMNANVLAALISSKMNAIAAGYQNGDKDPSDAHKALAEAIIEHLKSDAKVITSAGTGVIT